MADSGKFYEAAELVEAQLIGMIRDGLDREHHLSEAEKAGSASEDVSVQRSQLLFRAKQNMKRLLNMEKVLFP